MLNFEKRSQFNNFHLLNVNATFSRARAVQVINQMFVCLPHLFVFFYCLLFIDGYRALGRFSTGGRFIIYMRRRCGFRRPVYPALPQKYQTAT